MAPFVVFIGFLLIPGFVKRLEGAHSPLWISHPEFWVYPLQTLVCGAVVFYHRRHYAFGRVHWPVALGIGGVMFVLWTAPQAFLGFPRRVDGGFDPTAIASSAPLYNATLAARFLRLVIVVPLVEEIFWRGFLLRYCVSEDFTRIRFGTFTWLSFSIVSILFMLEHNVPDYPAALICGAAYNGVAYLSRTLSSCIVAHATTNLLLGIYVCATQQWGFW